MAKNDKTLTNLERLLSTQNFQSPEEVMKFLQANISDGQIPSFPKEVLSNREKAQDLAYDAYELPNKKALQLIEEALQLDPDCQEAYEYLANSETSLVKAVVMYEKAISIGRKRFGGRYLKEHKGHFWGFHETRPFMRCLEGLAECKLLAAEIDDALAIYEEMLQLNTNDNQGIRDRFMLYQIAFKNFAKYTKYAKKYPDDSSAFSLLNKALYAFLTEKESENAHQVLEKALKKNPFLFKAFTAKNSPNNLYDSYMLGSKEEAANIAYYAHVFWNGIPGALAWLKEVHQSH